MQMFHSICMYSSSSNKKVFFFPSVACFWIPVVPWFAWRRRSGAWTRRAARRRRTESGWKAGAWDPVASPTSAAIAGIIHWLTSLGLVTDACFLVCSMSWSQCLFWFLFSHLYLLFCFYWLDMPVLVDSVYDFVLVFYELLIDSIDVFTHTFVELGEALDWVEIGFELLRLCFCFLFLFVFVKVLITCNCIPNPRFWFLFWIFALAIFLGIFILDSEHLVSVKMSNW